jgi:hypothetical protein
MDTRVIQVLKKAKDLIQQGWCKGEQVKVIAGKNYYCTIGATQEASKQLGYNSEKIVQGGVYYHLDDIADDILTKFLPEGQYSLTNYNDKSTTRKNQIIRLFDKAISKSEEEINAPIST